MRSGQRVLLGCAGGSLGQSSSVEHLPRELNVASSHGDLWITLFCTHPLGGAAWSSERVKTPCCKYVLVEGVYIPRMIFKSKYYISLNFHVDLITPLSLAILFIIS